jgi:hypothetical protein
MSTAHRDSSYITLRRQQAALYAYNAGIQAAQNSNATVRTEQPSYQSLAVITDRKQGGCVCSATNAYTFVPTNINGAAQ